MESLADGTLPHVNVYATRPARMRLIAILLKSSIIQSVFAIAPAQVYLAEPIKSLTERHAPVNAYPQLTVDLSEDSTLNLANAFAIKKVQMMQIAKIFNNLTQPSTRVIASVHTRQTKSALTKD